MRKKIFITGASGCVGHYVLDELVGRHDLELHLLCRKPSRLRIDIASIDHVHVHEGNLKTIEKQRDLLSDCAAIIHIATDWSDSDYARYLNVQQTHEMFSYTSNTLEKIIYFSTASIMGPGNQVIPEAGKYGSGYVRSKYEAYQSLKTSPYWEKMYNLFPTLVFGGDETHPESHISQGLVPSLKFAKVIRFFYLDGKFHYIHAKDIAKVTRYLLDHDLKKRDLVLGFDAIDGKSAVRQVCDMFQIPIYFQKRINPNIVYMLARLFGIKIGPWEKHCIENPDMSYDVVNPETLGESAAFPKLHLVLEDIKTRSKWQC